MREAKRRLLARAVSQAPAYGRLVDASGFPRLSLGRASAQLMLGFCWRHYRAIARTLEHRTVAPDRSGATDRLSALSMVSLRAALSPSWARQDQARMIEELQRCIEPVPRAMDD